MDGSRSLFYLAVAKPELASHNSVLTCPVLTTKQPLCSFKLPPADADARPLGTPGKYRQVYKHVCVYACVCVFREKEKHTGVDVGGGEARICLAQHFFFTHSPHKGPSVLAASKSRRRPHDSLLPISRGTPQPPQRRRGSGAPGLYGSAVN